MGKSIAAVYEGNSANDEAEIMFRPKKKAVFAVTLNMVNRVAQYGITNRSLRSKL